MAQRRAETLKVTPAITADYGAPVKAHEVRKPVAVMTAPDGETIYDFGQNLAGVVRIKFNGKAGQVVTVRHAEIQNPDGSINGVWVKSKSDWYITIGWANSNWNLKANIIDMTRWNWRGDRRTMRSKYYDTVEQVYNGSSHALIQIYVTYTFGFGKKVTRDNEPGGSGSAASGILK